jgi:mono/diheme cytochrome c family protein
MLPAAGEELRHKGTLIVAIFVVLVIMVVADCVMTANVSALPEPGPLETWMAMKVKGWYISRAAGGSLPKAPTNDASSVSTGETLFSMGCTSCHGKDGRSPTNIGKSMYPRVLDLGAPEVQGMNDRELFWIIKNGIRLSGMPGFAKILSDEQIWQTTYYVRSLGKLPKQ